METIAAAVMALAAFALVGYPLLQRRAEPETAQTADNPQREALLSGREATYGAIKELDFEHELGNLSPADYQKLREHYRRRAAGILRELDEASLGPTAPAADQARPEGGTEEEIEQAVRLVRQSRAKGTRRPRAAPCPYCGEEAQPQDRYCVACGSPLQQRCAGCGAPYEKGDRFCRHCGAGLPGTPG